MENSNTNSKITKIDLHIASKLSKIREIKNISRRKIAAVSGISPQQLMKYENGTNRISASTLYRISLVYKVSVAYFFEGIKLEEF